MKEAKEANKKTREKREGAMLLSFFYTCASKQHHDLHDRESPMLSLSYTSGNFLIQNLTYIFQRWASSNCRRSSSASKMDAHPLSFFLSFHKLIALVHPLHGNPYSLTLVSIDGYLHSPLIRLVDVRLSPSFLSSPQPPYSIPPIVLYPWLTLMYCVKVEKV